jgi:dTDP-4-dehydrorhamnose 3,5-epimerase
MIFTETALAGAWLIDLERHHDERGFFARSWCQRELEARGLNSRLVQCNVSGNRARGTLRGLHFQVAPYAETKLVRCTRGAIYDVIVDLRPESPTFLCHVGAELTSENQTAVYIPEGFAHGFQTLTDDVEVFYQMSEYYQPDAAGGIRWNDPSIGVKWPIPVTVISPRDSSYRDLSTDGRLQIRGFERGAIS